MVVTADSALTREVSSIEVFHCTLCDLCPPGVSRVCIRPEVSRTKTFGFSKGVSKGEFSTILRLIKLNEEEVDWSAIDLRYLLKVCVHVCKTMA